MRVMLFKALMALLVALLLSVSLLWLVDRLFGIKGLPEDIRNLSLFDAVLLPLVLASVPLLLREIRREYAKQAALQGEFPDAIRVDRVFFEVVRRPDDPEETFFIRLAVDSTGAWGGEEVVRACGNRACCESLMTSYERSRAYSPYFLLVDDPKTQAAFRWLCLMHKDNRDKKVTGAPKPYVLLPVFDSGSGEYKARMSTQRLLEIPYELILLLSDPSIRKRVATRIETASQIHDAKMILATMRYLLKSLEQDVRQPDFDQGPQVLFQIRELPFRRGAEEPLLALSDLRLQPGVPLSEFELQRVRSELMKRVLSAERIVGIDCFPVIDYAADFDREVEQVEAKMLALGQAVRV